MQYQLWKSDNDNNWYWRFMTNGREIFRGSEGYVNKADAVRGMDIARGSAQADRIQYVNGAWQQL
jgi:uncharacterized protein YegP (UPF0339 family)